MHYPLFFPPVIGSSHQPNMSGGLHTTDVTMRKRSENRVYTDENIRDSIVMGELSSKFPDFGEIRWFGSFLNVSGCIWTIDTV